MRIRAILQARFAVTALLLILVVSNSGNGARAQDCNACRAGQSLSAASTESWTVRKRVNEVQVLFTAKRHGRFVTGLTESDISVLDNKTPAVVVAFRGQENLPLRIVLLIDTSNSIRNRFFFEKQAALVFLRQTLRSERDQAMVAGFNSRLRVVQGFSHDLRQLSDEIAGLRSSGATAMFDAVSQACGLLAQSGQGMVARVLIVVSDGDDNASRMSLRDAAESADGAQVTIYAIGTNYQSDDIASQDNLRYLSRATGGRALFPETAREVRHDFARISEDLRHRYAVAYRPPELARDGSFHRIRVQARHWGKNLKVRARQGYYAR